MDKFEQLELPFNDGVNLSYEQSVKIDDILDEIYAERVRQLQKWGVQNHSNFPEDFDHDDVKSFANDLKLENGLYAEEGTLSWYGILMEELAEAFCEEDDGKLEEELIQVAAVVAAWIEDIRGTR